MASNLPVCGALLCLAVLQGASYVSASKSDPLIKITDGNWRQMLTGEWMVEFIAPWCPACRSLQSTWKSVAEWSRDLDINVGVVDVTENPELSGRFLVTSLPTIYHVKDGEFRYYPGEKKENDLLGFVDDKKWKDVEPVSSWKHPDSFLMALVGFFFRCALVLREIYTTMSTEYGIPEWGCYLIYAVGTIITGIILGLAFVLCWDWLFPVKYEPSHTIPRRQIISEDKDKDDESDLVDDTEQPPSKDKSPNIAKPAEMEQPPADSNPSPPAGATTTVRKRQKEGGNSTNGGGDATAATS